MKKKVSIIIPAYNAEKYIYECLQSVVGLGCEIILVDNNSRDCTLGIAKQFKERITILKCEKQGVSNARNMGIEKCNGDYVMFLDSDDIIDTAAIKKFLENIDYSEDIIYFNKNIDSSISKTQLLEYVVGIKEPVLAGPYCKLFKRSTVLKKNRFDNKVINGEDMLFNIECLLNANTYRIVNESIYLYRQTSNSATRVFDRKLIESDKEFKKQIAAIFEKQQFDQNYKKKIIDYLDESSISMIADRASRESRAALKKAIREMERNPYAGVLGKRQLVVSKKDALVIKLVRNRRSTVLYMLYKFKHVLGKRNENRLLRI